MKDFTSNQQIKYGAILSYIGIVVYILIGLLYTPWMIKVIGKNDYGLYTLAYSVISFFLFDFGISTAIQRFVAKYLAEGNKEKVNNCISIIYKLYLYIDVLIIIILASIFFFIPDIYKELSQVQLERLKMVFLIAGAFGVFAFPFIPLNGILSAHEQFVQLKICDLIGKVLTVSVNVVCLYLGGGLYSIVITNVTVGIIVIITKLIIVNRGTSVTINWGYQNKTEMKELLSFSGWTTIVAICQRCIFNIAPTILGMFVGAEVIAVFGISVSLEAYTFTFAFALNGLFLPKISRLIAEKESLLPLMIRVGRIQIFTIGAVVIGFIVVGKDFINAWLGQGFEDAYLCTLLLISPSFFILPADIAEQTLIASDKVKFRAYVYMLMAATNIALSYVMMAWFGLIGLALSIFIAYMVRSLALYYTYYRILKIDVLNFLYNSYIKMGLGLLIALVASYYVSNLVSNYIFISGWYNVILKILITSTIYLVSMILFALNTSEKKLLITMINKLVMLK